MDLEYVVSRVQESFPVIEAYSTPLGVTFVLPLLPPEKTREEFRKMAVEFLKRGIVPRLYKEGDLLKMEVYETLGTAARGGALRKAALFVITLLMVFISGWSMSVGTLKVAKELGIPDPFDPLYMTVMHVAGLLLPLAVHELGHMVASRKWGGDWEFPTFIPAPPPPLGFGTFGAIISSRKPVINRDELFDIGISGPLAGFIPGLLVGIIGIQGSIRLPPDAVERVINETSPMPIPLVLLPFGNVQGTILLTPLGVAGALVLFITFLNLLPVSQLDGGHVAYSLMKESSYRAISWLAILVGFLLNPFLGVFLLLFNSMVRHPPPLDEYTPISRRRKQLGAFLYFALLLFTLPAG